MKSGNPIERIGAVIAFAAVVSGCTSLVSEKPIFSQSDFDKSDGILGFYRALNVEPAADGYVVQRENAAELKLIGIKDKNGTSGENWTQVVYADAAAIPLGGGDYVLQISCALTRDDKGWTPTPWVMTKGYANYALAMQARRLNAYWILTSFSGVDSGLLTRYGVVSPPKDSTLLVLPASMSRQAAIAFFRDVAADAMTKADGFPGLAENFGPPKPLDPKSDEAKNLVLSSPEQCRSITQHEAAQQ